MILSREQGTNSEHHAEVSLKGGGRQGGYSVNPEKFVVFFGVCLNTQVFSISVTVFCSFLHFSKNFFFQ